MVERCEHCGCTEIEEEPTQGNAICTGCGVVLAEHAIVSDIQFMENAHGQSSAIGQFVSHESTGMRPIFQGNCGSLSKESREITYFKGRKKINSLASQLDLTNHCNEVAYNFYKLCVSKGLTKGRRSNCIIGACVYMACRTEQTPHMLIDVSDAIETDVYELGHTYLRLSQALCLNYPAIDPCLYIMRFSYKLHFGDKTHQVSETALRLVQRMNKDWMSIGRRPSGVCGAALLIAARLNNFNRTIHDIIKVVKVHESTIRKRLTEFGSTPTSELTPDEFMNTDLTQEEDPPAFKAARRKEEEERLQKLLEKEKDLPNQFTELQRKIEQVLRDQKKKLRGIWAAAAASSSDAASDAAPINGSNSSDRESNDTMQFIAEATMESIKECINSNMSHSNSETEVIHEILPTTASMGLKQTIEEYMEIRPSEPEAEESGILDLEGIDDEEIDSYILSKRECERKTNLWMYLNKDFLEQQERKKEQERLEEEQRKREGKPPKKKRTYKKKNKNELPANTAGEAMERLIKTKKLSNKIDYDVLRNLNDSSSAIAGSEHGSTLNDARSVTSRASSSRSSRASKRSSVPQVPIPESVREIMQSLTGEKTPRDAMQREHATALLDDDEDDEAPSPKRTKIEVNTMKIHTKTDESNRYCNNKFADRDFEDEAEEDDSYGLLPFSKRAGLDDNDSD